MIAPAFFVLYVVWGSTFLAMGSVVHGGIPPLLATGARLLFAGGILLAWHVHRGGRIAPRATWPGLAGSGALMFVGGSGLSMIALRTVDSGLVALLSASMPVWMAIAARERLVPLAKVGIALGLAGLVLVLQPGLAGGSVVGLVAGALSPIAWVAGALWSRSRLRALPAAALAGHQMLFAAAVAFAIGIARGEPADLAPTGDAVLALGYLVVFGNVLGYTSFVYLMARVPAAKVATYAYVNPVIAVVLGWLVAGEQLAPRVLAGAAVVLVGVALVNGRTA